MGQLQKIGIKRLDLEGKSISLNFKAVWVGISHLDVAQVHPRGLAQTWISGEVMPQDLHRLRVAGWIDEEGTEHYTRLDMGEMWMVEPSATEIVQKIHKKYGMGPLHLLEEGVKELINQTFEKAGSTFRTIHPSVEFDILVNGVMDKDQD
jgi:dissimilatory sulfite reductase (desulfoviridin) alpha/beta subunit